MNIFPAALSSGRTGNNASYVPVFRDGRGNRGQTQAWADPIAAQARPVRHRNTRRNVAPDPRTGEREHCKRFAPAGLDPAVNRFPYEGRPHFGILMGGLPSLAICSVTPIPASLGPSEARAVVFVLDENAG